MSRGLDVVVGVSILAFLSIIIAVIFPVHDRLYSWPWYGVAFMVFGWLFAFTYAINLLRFHTEVEQDADV